jgi:antitoxin (DNA-binding transcriptional repressor) of toxin-antitoxin stability system
MQITITAEELESRCLELIDQVEADGLIVVITKDDRPIAMLMPIPANAESDGPSSSFRSDSLGLTSGANNA